MCSTPSITCPKCDKVSYSKADIQNEYCGKCGWHSRFIYGELTPDQFLQIEQAARGCISGNLIEWPRLDKAFLALGISLSSSTNHMVLRDKANEVLTKRKAM